MGEPNTGNLYWLQSSRRHCELKYLSSNGGEIKNEIPVVATSEVGGGQT